MVRVALNREPGVSIKQVADDFGIAVRTSTLGAESSRIRVAVAEPRTDRMPRRTSTTYAAVITYPA